MDKKVKKIGGQDTELVIELLQKMFDKKSGPAWLFIKDDIACSFFRMVMNDEDVDDHIRNMAETSLLLYQFFSAFDEMLIESFDDEKES